MVVILMAVAAASQSSESTASRQAFLWRSLDSWELYISQAVAMREDPFPSVRAKAVMVMASNVDAVRLPLLSLYMGASYPPQVGGPCSSYIQSPLSAEDQ